MADMTKAQLTDLISHEADGRGLEVVLVETGGSKRDPLVRVYLDREGGITIDAIAEANRWIKAILDELPAYTHGYTLEVSSPGIDRPLSKLADFARFTGEEARLAVSPEFEGHKRFTGVLAGVDDERVLLETDGQVRRIPYRAITSARLKGRIDMQQGRTADDGI